MAEKKAKKDKQEKEKEKEKHQRCFEMTGEDKQMTRHLHSPINQIYAVSFADRERALPPLSHIVTQELWEFGSL